MNKVIIQEARRGAKELRATGYLAEADAIECLADDAHQENLRRQELSKLKKGDRVVMHTCMEARNPKYAGRIWTCSTDAFRHKGHNYCTVFLEEFSGSFSAEFLQIVDVTSLEAANV